MAIEIRPIYALEDMYAAVELQKLYWGNQLESVVPAHMLFSIATHGGHVLAAMDGDLMVGVLIGFIGTDHEYERPAAANLQMVSKRMVILPEYRNRGLAFQLKLKQRELTIDQAIKLVTWTFDPLLAPNAHLNIRKLGAICPKFLENYYGTSGRGGLAVLGISDRLYVEWWVTNKRVKARLEDQRRGLGLSAYLDAGVSILNPTSAATDNTPWPARQSQDASGSMALLEIPVDFHSIMDADTVLAQAWQHHVREQFQKLMQAGYIVTDFVRALHEGRDRVFYLLSRMGAEADLNDISPD